MTQAVYTGEQHSYQYGYTKLLFTQATQDLSKVLLGARRYLGLAAIATAGLSATIVGWFAGLSATIYTSWSACFAARLAASSALLRSCLAF